MKKLMLRELEKLKLYSWQGQDLVIKSTSLEPMLLINHTVLQVCLEEEAKLNRLSVPSVIRPGVSSPAF